jgi:hypothetical protein
MPSRCRCWSAFSPAITRPPAQPDAIVVRRGTRCLVLGLRGGGSIGKQNELARARRRYREEARARAARGGARVTRTCVASTMYPWQAIEPICACASRGLRAMAHRSHGAWGMQILRSVPFAFSLVLLVASCVESQPSPDEQDGTALATILPASAEEYALSDTVRLVVCVRLGNAGPEVREVFCGSLPRPDARARCYGHVNDGAIEWANWCYGEFGD